ncbi:MAG: hypothetical protein AB1720_06880 [Pseudomonadota bacterium]
MRRCLAINSALLLGRTVVASPYPTLLPHDTRIGKQASIEDYQVLQKHIDETINTPDWF